MKKEKKRVSIQKVDENIKTSIGKALIDLGGINQYIGKTDRVLLKPNINGTECITNKDVVESVIEILLDNGILNIAIAESTFGDAKNTEYCFRQNGYNELAEKYDIELINLNESEIIEIEVQKPIVKKTLKIAKEIYEADKIINIPVMKVHYATGITLCLKNLKGILVGSEKRTFHDVGLNEGILDLNRMIKPTLNIIDATTCMERMGPRGGDLLQLDSIIAGVNSGITDYVGMLVMGYELDEVKHLKMFIEENEIDIDDIQIIGTPIDEIKRSFKKVNLSNIENMNLDIESLDACSSCENAFLLSVSCAENINLKNKKIFLGSKQTNNENTSEKETVAFGKCAIKNMQNADYKIYGCPPYPFELGRQLSKMEE